MGPLKVFLGVLALALAGLFAPGFVGAAVLFVIVAGLGALMVYTWPVTAPRTRAVRLIILAAFLVMAVAKVS